MSEMPELISIEEAAKILKVAVQTMYEIANSEDFSATVIVTKSKGRKLYRIHKGKFLKWIDCGGMVG